MGYPASGDDPKLKDPQDRYVTTTGNLNLEVQEPPAPDRAVRAARLRADGWTVEAIATELGCSRRTVQRYLRTAAA
jgi:DNA-binding NarL/FixJ family response regulator